MATIAASHEITTTNILVRALQLARLNSARAAFALVALSLGGSLIDTGLVGQGLNVVFSFLFVFLQFWLTQGLLGDLGLRFASRPRLAAFFFQGILVSLAILFGFILLVVPGIILMVRWSMCGPVLISSDLSISESISESWRQSDGHFWPILFVLLIVYGSLLVGAGVGYLGAELGWLDLPYLVGIAIANLAVATGSVAAWHVYVALYAMIVRPDDVADVFA